MPKIWDVHVHFPRNFQKPDEDPQVALNHLAEKLIEVGTVRASLLCPTTRPWQQERRRAQPSTPPADAGTEAPATPAFPPLTHESCIEMAARHGDLFVPHAVVDPEVDTYERIRHLHDIGYRGLKIIGTRRPYDTRDYFPVYRAAQEAGMPILFHCGVVSGGMDLLRSHPRRDPASAKRWREMDERERKEAAGEPVEGAPPRGGRGAGRESSALYMRPFHLESIANRFPRLKIIGAHFGGTGNYDESASVARWRRWVFFDMSGGRTLERHAVERGLIGTEIPIEKLTFGSDCAADEIHLHVERFEKIFEDLGLSDEEKDLLWYRNAAELFGLEEPVWAQE